MIKILLILLLERVISFRKILYTKTQILYDRNPKPQINIVDSYNNNNNKNITQEDINKFLENIKKKEIIIDDDINDIWDDGEVEWDLM